MIDNQDGCAAAIGIFGYYVFLGLIAYTVESFPGGDLWIKAQEQKRIKAQEQRIEAQKQKQIADEKDEKKREEAMNRIIKKQQEHTDIKSALGWFWVIDKTDNKMLLWTGKDQRILVWKMDPSCEECSSIFKDMPVGSLQHTKNLLSLCSTHFEQKVTGMTLGHCPNKTTDIQKCYEYHEFYQNMIVPLYTNAVSKGVLANRDVHGNYFFNANLFSGEWCEKGLYNSAVEQQRVYDIIQKEGRLDNFSKEMFFPDINRRYDEIWPSVCLMSYKCRDMLSNRARGVDLGCEQYYKYWKEDGNDKMPWDPINPSVRRVVLKNKTPPIQSFIYHSSLRILDE